MANHNPHSPEESHQLSHQQGEHKGKIKRPQQTDANMAEEDLPRGSEPETRGASRGGVMQLRAWRKTPWIASLRSQ